MIFDAAPDSVVRDLCNALTPEGPYDASLTTVRELLEAERQDRRVRNIVFAPIAPLCRTSFPGRLAFPPRALKLMWRGLKHALPSEVDQATALLAEWREDGGGVAVLDVLCEHACEAVESAATGDFAEARAACEAMEPGLAVTLVTCLRLSSVTRHALERLPDWLGRMTGEKAAEVRLAYRDVCTISEDAGPEFVEMLSGHISEPWQVLRVVSGIMERPAEAYLAGSELSHVAERLLDDIDERLALIGRFGPTSSPQEARQAAQAIDGAVNEIAEIEQSVGLSPSGAWGRRVAAHKKALALKVEAQLRSLEDQVAKALPLQPVRTGPRSSRGMPRLSADPEPLVVAKAMTLLHFASDVRASASAGGFASTRAKALENICARIDSYVEDLLDHLRSGGEDATEEENDRARAYLEILADFSGLARDDKAAQIVRRRAAAA
jgi:hypothetical protein